MEYSFESVDRICTELEDTVHAAYEALLLVDEMEASRRPAPGKWSKKEIVGHLIDSAANNHHRFVRAPAQTAFSFPGYEQDDWVNRQAYNERLWPELLQLWLLYNSHIAYVCRRIPEENLSIECRIGSYEPCSLGYLVEDYLAHLKHHLKALL